MNTNSNEQKKATFVCKICNFSILTESEGRTKKFQVEFTEKCYIIKDPFAPHLQTSKFSCENALVIGSECRHCGFAVCSICSLFYKRTQCIDCANKLLQSYPVEIRKKIKNMSNK